MTAAQCAQAIEQGAGVVLGLAAAGCQVVGFGEMGDRQYRLGVLDHPIVLTGVPLADCVGRGTGLDDAGLARKQALLEQALTRYRAAGGGDDPFAVLGRIRRFRDGDHGWRHAGGRRKRRWCCSFDGFIVGSAALVAARLEPALLDYCVFCHRSAEPGHRAQLQALQAEPLLDLGLRLGEGTGAALAFPLVSVGGRLPQRDGQLRVGRRRRLAMLRRELEYFFGAVRFFTRLPVPAWVGHSAEALQHSARWLPAVGSARRRHRRAGLSCRAATLAAAGGGAAGDGGDASRHRRFPRGWAVRHRRRPRRRLGEVAHPGDHEGFAGWQLRRRRVVAGPERQVRTARRTRSSAGAGGAPCRPCLVARLCDLAAGDDGLRRVRTTISPRPDR